MDENKELVLALTEAKYLDYLVKTGASEEALIEAYMGEEDYNYNSSEKDTLIYFLKESSEEVEAFLSEMEAGAGSQSTSALAKKVAAQGTELEKLLKQQLNTPEGKKNAAVIKKQIARIQKQLDKLNKANNPAGLGKVILAVLITEFKVLIANIAFWVGTAAAVYFTAAAAGISLVGIVSGGVLVWAAIALVSISSLMAILRKVIMMSTKRDLTSAEKEKVAKVTKAIVDKTKAKLAQAKAKK